MQSPRSGSNQAEPPPAKAQVNHPKSNVVSFVASESNCPYCKKASHPLFRCSQYHRSSVKDKLAIVQQLELCLNCINSSDHWAQACTRDSCKKCGSRHHSTLHGAPFPRREPQVSNPTNDVQSLFARDSLFQVLLSTVVVDVEDRFGQMHRCRALVDSGSQANFATVSLVNKLQLTPSRYTAQVSGIGAAESSQRPKGVVSVKFRSLRSEFQLTSRAIVLTQISTDVPTCPVDTTAWSESLRELTLADPNFDKPGRIDMLLGAEIFAKIFTGQKTSFEHGPSAFKTELGWVLSGECRSTEPASQSRPVNALLSISLEDRLKTFWEVEEVPAKPLLSPEETECEQLYSRTTARDEFGKYTVNLPFKSGSSPALGESRERARRQFLSLEKRLQTQDGLRRMYVDFMTEYLDLGHMEPVASHEQPKSSQVYYIPHHGVLRESSTTTKLRAVYNASAVTSTGTSLNDHLLVGTTLQSSLMELILRFRLHKVALVADIEKMYRQIWVAPEHRDYQRIIWRKSPTEPIAEYRLKTVTYGTASAPFSAIRTLVQLAADEGNDVPLAAAALRHDFYVDDLISGAGSEDEARALKSDLTTLLARGGFNLRKWSSNFPSALNGDPSQETSTPTDLESIKTLGISWSPSSDQFHFAMEKPSTVRLSKRSLLAEVAKLFDPLGWLAPTILIGKILIQRLWVLKSDWDDAVPDELRDVWMAVCRQWSAFDEVRINRFLVVSPADTIEIHGFSDASENAYGAVVYIRACHPNNEVTVSLLASKTRVSPLKQISIPKLELCAAVLLIRLLKFITATLSRLKFTVHAWTDSTIVLSWLSDLPRRWKTFVANRVSEIQEFLPPSHWHHVASSENPADLCSRGLLPSDLVNSDLWWRGPSWLSNPDLPLLPTVPSLSEDIVEEQRDNPILSFLTGSCPDHLGPLIEKASNLHRLVRTVAYCVRFIRVQQPAADRDLGAITAAEYDHGLKRLVYFVQHLEFKPEFNALNSGTNLPTTSSLKSLNPFVDDDGLLRVGGRLQHSSLGYDAKHPLILPATSNLTALVIRSEHLRLLHGGPSLLASTLVRRYWIPKSRSLIRRILFSCTVCFRYKAKPATQLMGNLPAPRVQPARPFLSTGVDYAGPILLKASLLRRSRGPPAKAWIVIFVCMATKAVHLELASEMTSSCFVAAFTRFISRRGLVRHMYSDCGTNFVGAQRELNFTTSRPFQQDIQTATQSENIEWHFNPPSSPHFGGLWEAGVKSTKSHLKKIVGSSVLTYEEYLTVLTQVEACLNSRPLCQLSINPNDFSCLTPGHFLIGEPLTSIPEPDLTELKTNRLTRWKMIQQMTQRFWKTWSTEYLHRLHYSNGLNGPASNLISRSEIWFCSSVRLLCSTAGLLPVLQRVFPEVME